MMDLIDMIFAKRLLGKGGRSADPTKPVKFFDYDGTLVYSYTAAEFAALDAMPANPTHEGLTAQGWNWTLADAKAYVADCGALVIGQHYVTTDGNTRIFIHLEPGRTSPYLGLCVNGIVGVDWGDGSALTKIEGSSTSTNINTQHQYPAAGGDFVITIWITEGNEVWIKGDSSYGSRLLWATANSSSTYLQNRVYQKAIKEAYIGERFKIGTSAFRNTGLQKISLPTSVYDGWGERTFSECYDLPFITVPSGTTFQGSVLNGSSSIKYIAFPKAFHINAETFSSQLSKCYSLAVVTPPPISIYPEYFFEKCYSLRALCIPEGVTKLYYGAFVGCSALSSVTIPASMELLRGAVFEECCGLGEIHFRGTTPPTVRSDTFNKVPPSCKIYVPASEDHSVLAAYQAASDYPSPQTYTYLEE